MPIKLLNRIKDSEIDIELKNKTINRVNECINFLNKKLKLKVKLESEEPVVFFKNSKTAGYVWRGKYGDRIFLNWILLKENEEMFLKEIIPHEVCHLFQYTIENVDAVYHGKVWKELMGYFNLAPNIYHDFDTINAKRKLKERDTFKYICNCSKHILSEKQHEKALNGTKFICKKCKSNIVFLSKMDK